MKAKFKVAVLGMALAMCGSAMANWEFNSERFPLRTFEINVVENGVKKSVFMEDVRCLHSDRVDSLVVRAELVFDKNGWVQYVPIDRQYSMADIPHPNATKKERAMFDAHRSFCAHLLDRIIYNKLGGY